MADAILLPGTEMEVIEKYPLSRRLDHPTFGDVCKTTFAKGVITDFEKVSDDPIQVKSRVKVEIGDGDESDFIPIFFTPKEAYWDDETATPPVLAQDLDEETGAFKQAWMSFRVDDEVVVMLKEGVPVAVMGFADGKPRIGEDIVKVIAPHSDGTPRFFHLQMSKVDGSGIFGGLGIAKNGPDGLALNLAEEYGPSPENYYQHPANQYNPDTSGDEKDYGLLSTYSQPSPGGTILTRHKESFKHQYREFIFPLGPILYIVQILATTSSIYIDAYDLGSGATPPEHYEPTNGVPLDFGMRVVSGVDCGGYSAVTAVTGPNAWFIVDIQLRAAIYSEELVESIESIGSISAQQAHEDYSAHGWNYEWGTKYPDTFWQTSGGFYNLLNSLFGYGTWPNWDESLFNVRPHNG